MISKSFFDSIPSKPQFLMFVQLMQTDQQLPEKGRCFGNNVQFDGFRELLERFRRLSWATPPTHSTDSHTHIPRRLLLEISPTLCLSPAEVLVLSATAIELNLNPDNCSECSESLFGELVCLARSRTIASNHMSAHCRVDILADNLQTLSQTSRHRLVQTITNYNKL